MRRYSFKTFMIHFDLYIHLDPSFIRNCKGIFFSHLDIVAFLASILCFLSNFLQQILENSLINNDSILFLLKSLLPFGLPLLLSGLSSLTFPLARVSSISSLRSFPSFLFCCVKTYGCILYSLSTPSFDLTSESLSSSRY